LIHELSSVIVFAAQRVPLITDSRLFRAKHRILANPARP
jgi:hypothetical protein